LFSHFWLATPQEVLQADWQEVWHSPQPPFFADAAMSLVAIVLILLILVYLQMYFFMKGLYHNNLLVVNRNVLKEDNQI